LLRKQAQDVIRHIDRVTVSLDAATPELYQKIRGVDALDVILDGMQIVSAAGVPVSTRTTLMRANFHQIPLIVDTALEAGANSASFLTVDTHNAHAFGPRFEHDATIPLAQEPVVDEFGGLTADDLPEFATVLDRLEETHAEHFADGRIEESPAKLRSYYHYFAAPYGLGEFTPPRCNAPHISAVVNVDGQLQPCYFLPTSGQVNGQGLQEAINSEDMVKMREAYRQGEREECGRCVCPLYRGPRSLLRGF
jgi:MoaA/NifB/PqqE/SkfB family radical SAM enzyme